MCVNLSKFFLFPLATWNSTFLEGLQKAWVIFLTFNCIFKVTYSHFSEVWICMRSEQYQRKLYKVPRHFLWNLPSRSFGISTLQSAFFNKKNFSTLVLCAYLQLKIDSFNICWIILHHRADENWKEKDCGGDELNWRGIKVFMKIYLREESFFTLNHKSKKSRLGMKLKSFFIHHRLA